MTRGSAWGTFTIACTIPIALFVGLWMYKIRKGRILEASLIGGVLVLLATFLGASISHSRFGSWFDFSTSQITLWMAVYGFFAAVLPVRVLLVPRDYLSSFLKIGTIAILVGGVIIANPKLEAPAINHVFLHGGPTVPGNIFPFLFITIMCGAISGFHALDSSGTTPKMVRKESDARMIGYGAMLIEGLVGVVALIAATTLPVRDYYGMNTALADAPKYEQRIHLVDRIGRAFGRQPADLRAAHAGNAARADRRGGDAGRRHGAHLRPGRGTLHVRQRGAAQFALEVLVPLRDHVRGAVHPHHDRRRHAHRNGFCCRKCSGKSSTRSWGKTIGRRRRIFSTILVVAGWAYFINANEMKMIWPMFGISNQMLAVIAMAVSDAYLVNAGHAKYLPVTLLPMLFVATTTFSAGVDMIHTQWMTIITQLHILSPRRLVYPSPNRSSSAAWCC